MKVLPVLDAQRTTVAKQDPGHQQNGAVGDRIKSRTDGLGWTRKIQMLSEQKSKRVSESERRQAQVYPAGMPYTKFVMNHY